MLAVSRPLRAARAAVFAAVCVVLSAAGHAFMTSEPLPVWTVAAGFAGVFAVAYAAAGRERSWAGIAALLAVGQVALHTLFSFGMAASATAMSGHAGGTAPLSVLDRLLCGGRDASGHIILPPGWSARDIVAAAGLDPDAAGALPTSVPAADAAHGAGPMLFDGGFGMLAAHLAAALAAAWWLRRGEAALFGVLRRLHAVAVAPLRAVLALLFGTVPAGYVPSAARRVGRTAARPRTAHLRHDVVRRGPPAFATAC
ncbi:hypothetical protein [Streptodolium elevatio]|uniref:hypothetical protein n=1 Tax=Streptodolium elevatio TaxID=3157996 RepID=UPI003F4D6C71